jgi:hypothetical protein
VGIFFALNLCAIEIKPNNFVIYVDLCKIHCYCLFNLTRGVIEVDNQSKNDKPISISKTIDEYYNKESKDLSFDETVVDIDSFVKADKEFSKGKEE